MRVDASAFNAPVQTLLRSDSPPLSRTLYKSLLRACCRRKSLALAQQIHYHLACHKLHLSASLGNYLVVALASCGAISDARTIFDCLSQRNVYSWTAMISVYTERDQTSTALRFHELMRRDGIQPDNFTFASLFKACAGIPAPHVGKDLHADAEKRGLLDDVIVGNSVVTMYGKCGLIHDSEFVFRTLSEPDVSSWNAMVGAYVDHGDERRALYTFRQMCEEGVRPNSHTFASLLLACTYALEKDEDQHSYGFRTKLGLLAIGQALHGYVRKVGLAREPFIVSGLLNFYGKFGTLKETENAFVQTADCNIVSWSAMLYAYVDQAQGIQALHLFHEMQRRGLEPDQHAFVMVLQACGILADQGASSFPAGQFVKMVSLEISRALHHDAKRKGFMEDIFIGNILVNVYGRCGSVEEAEVAYIGMPVRDIVSSTALFCAFVEQGECHRALQLYKQLVQENERLNNISLICILQGCGQAESIEMCRDIHFNLASTGFDQDMQIAATLMKAYRRCASTFDAMAVLDSVWHGTAIPWSVCIEDHTGGPDGLTSLKVFDELKLLGACPDEPTFASVLSLCSHAGLVASGLEYFVSMSTSYSVIPTVEHYGSVVDLFARAGAFDKIEKLLESMPCLPDLSLWLCLLSACRSHGNLELAKRAFENAVRLFPKQTAAYALMFSICCDKDKSLIDYL